jgi:hypothetical protein
MSDTDTDTDTDTYPAVPGPYRAFVRSTESWGPERITYEEACADAAERTGKPTAALTRSRQRWIVAARDPESPSRAVDADSGRSLWPTHGMGCGAVRWPAS